MYRLRRILHSGILVLWYGTGSADHARDAYQEHGKAEIGEGVVDAGLHVMWSVGDVVAYAHEKDFGMDNHRFILHYGVALPLLLIILASFVAVALTRSRRRKHRQRTGLCHFCGYDLRATPNRCPECGAVPTGAKA